MKRLILPIAALTLLLTACTAPADPGIKNAIQFAREKIAEVAPAQVENVDKITWERTDSVVAFFEFNMITMEASHLAVTPPFVMARIDSIFEVVDSLFNAMQYLVQGLPADSLLPKAIHHHEWRKMHHLTIHMKSGKTKPTDIIMDRDCLTPIMTGADYQHELRKTYDQVLDTRYSMSDYYLFNGIY